MYLYILRCKDNSLYTGITNDIIKRVKKHTGILKGGAKYTKSHPVIFIEAVWEITPDSCIRKIEYKMKKLSHTKKECIISNPENILLDCDLNLPDSIVKYIDTSEYNEYFNFNNYK